MPVSNSNDFSTNSTQIIQDSLILIGGLEDDEQATAEQNSYGMRTLNRMAKAWSTRGLKAWCWNELELPLVAGQASYSIGPGGNLVADRPVRIANARKIITNDETEIRITDRATYMAQPNKISTGEPVFVYYDPQLGNGQLYVWPTPDRDYEIRFSAQQYPDDFDDLTNEPYFPPEWYEALVYGLAWRLCPKYEVNPADRQEVAAMAQIFLKEAEDGDQEQGSIYLQPELINAY